MRKPTPAQALYFLHRFRGARYKVLEDAENFKEVCFVLEELGAALLGKKKNGLGAYTKVFLDFLGETENSDFNFCLHQLRDARNGEAHTGAYARNSALKSLDVSLRFEERLLKYATKAKHIMSQAVVYAETYHTLSSVRNIMLSSSFSYLPILIGEHYHILDDLTVSRMWGTTRDDDRYTISISDLMNLSLLRVADRIQHDEPIANLINRDGGWPVFVEDEAGRLIGIITAFDLL